MLILHNARIRTMSPERPFVTALAIAFGRILAAGSDEDILALAAPGARKLDLRGQTVWPGLTDAHIHFEYYAQFLQMVDCETDTREECIRRVGERAAASAPGAWIIGHGWNQNVWAGGNGTAEQLDAVSGGRPVYLTHKSGHSGWANSAALQLAGITTGGPDPKGGVIERDARGKLTGILYENAMGLVDSIVPQPTLAELVEMLDRAQHILWQSGLTGLHDYDRRSCFEALQVLEQQGRLKLRINKSIPVELLDHADALGLRSGFGSDFLHIGSVKLFADGALGPRTAAMLAPYEGESEYTGMGLLDAEEIYEYGQKAAHSGLSLAIHAIGDRANHECLNAYEQLRGYESQHGLPRLRHRIEHVQILHPDDLDRLARLDVVASMQPIHATSDMFIADKHWGKRSAGAYAWNTLLTSGAALAFGSDAPVESPNPFWGLHAAVTRTRLDGAPNPDGWYPEQRLSLEQALAAYTTGPAFAAGWENTLGRLAPGFHADLILLDSDPFDLPAAELGHVRPSATMVSGEWVYQRE